MSERLAWPYVFRAWGIIGVYYGHLVGSYWLLGSRAGHTQMKFLATFVVAGFFMLAGFFYRDRGLSFPGFLARQWRMRLVPVLFFHVVGFGVAALALLATGRLNGKTMLALGKLLLSIVAGWPMLAAVGWFLVCLFMVELFHFLLRKVTLGTPWLVVSIVAFGLATWALPFEVKAEQQLYHWQSWWLLTPALAGTVFYQLGVLARRLDLFAERSRGVTWVVSLVSLAVLLLIFDRNQGPFPQSRLDMPLLGLSAFGQLGWFYLTGVVGSVFLFFASRLMPAGRVMRVLGENSLLLMCLNSYFLLWIDRPLAAWLYNGLGWQSTLAITLSTAVGTVLSFLIAIPVVLAIRRWLPWAGGEVRAPRPVPVAAPAAAALPVEG
ncbi:MAG TPA: acyltransferase family protein [Thermoanaerobaculia bacterium]|nr:acyltransferase family protein [Thermoanaerobaculia bacterium]